MDKLGRMMYLMEFDNNRDNSELKKKVQQIVESKQTEQQTINILKQSIDINKANDIINKFKSVDSSKNQILLPIMASAYLEVGDNGLNDLLNVFKSTSELINSNKINNPVVNSSSGSNKYIVNNKTFDGYLRFSEYIHGLEGIESGYNRMKGTINTDVDEPPIWEGNNIRIYDGNDVGKCIKYTTGGLTGRHYSFCIGQPANSMWQSYRDTKTSTFYYIVDSNREMDDPLHIVVLDYTKHGIELTDANNTTGTIAEYGSDVDRYLQYLQSKSVPVNEIFKNKPKTEKEIELEKKLGQRNINLDWFKSLSYEEKSAYIGRGHSLGDEQFEYLWQFRNNTGGYKLLHSYLDTGLPISEKQFNLLISES